MAKKPELKSFHVVLDDYNFCFKEVLLRLKTVYALKCLPKQAMRPLVYQKQSLKVSVQSVPLNCVNSDKVFQISKLNISLCLNCIMHILFCIVIAIPKGIVW